MEESDDEVELSDQEVAFLRGVFAARGIVAPSAEEFRDAMALLERHCVPMDLRPN